MFWRNSLRLLRHKPATALLAIYWQLTRRKVRAGNVVRDGASGLPLAYRLWLDAQERLVPDHNPADRDGATEPHFAILLLIDEGGPAGLAKRSQSSIEAQSYSKWSIRAVGPSDLLSAVQHTGGDYFLILRAGDWLARSTLLRLADHIRRERPAMIYGDEDRPGKGTRERQPWFKPAWNEEMFLAIDYLSSLVAVRRDVLERAARRVSVQSLDALLLALTSEAAPHIVHVPAIMSHARVARDPERARLRAVSRHLAGRATCLPGPFDTVHVQWPLPASLPLVTIIIPTRDKVELLRACLDSVLGKTDYSEYEIIVVDNGSNEEATLSYLQEVTSRPNIRVIRSEAEYNFSALNNLAVREANGSFILLLNNDTEVISPTWLSEMMRYALRDDVGAVGAKLLYEDGSIQHAGVIIGMGEAAGHAHRFLPPGEPGYFWQPHVAQFVSAVTAACLLVRRDKYDAVGGLDEEALAIAYNDVDLCLKLERAGWRNVYTPHSQLYHHESKSRGNDLSPKHLDRYMRELRVFQNRWNARTYQDPLHSANLDRYSESYTVKLS